ncbi:MAG TPA: polysaccharide biosynthesis tyrosine autokinase [Planctomycetes bacterium]|nr:polysaccharide biosynthesis tyrosine autokinase [Planctomycetota bacterium]HIL37105.1 polysaccharide biosynthesis tyrosine autokinase [Planctomycetota bacterium]
MPSTKSSDVLAVPQPEESLGVPVTGEELCVITAPRSQQAEQFRVLRNSIQALNPDGASHTLVLTSALRGEGKTVATLNLAAAMTELPGIQVLVVDADLHQPSIEESLGLPLRKGLADLLAGGVSLDSAVRATSVPGVSILGAGTLPKNPSQLLGSDRMRTVLDKLRQNYSYVLIDTPAAAGVSDASLLGAMADGILMVVRLGSTPRQFVQQTINVLESLGGNVLGTCLTGAEEPDTTVD